MGTGDTRVLKRQALACLVGLVVGATAFALVDYPYRILAAAVLGLAGTLALWPLSGGSSAEPAVRREFRVFGRRRVRELESQVAALSAEIERTRSKGGQIAAALRGLEEWAALQEPEPKASVTDISGDASEGRGGFTWRAVSSSTSQRRGRL